MAECALGENDLQRCKKSGMRVYLRIPMIPVSDSGDFDRASRAGYFLL